ncbi:HIT domain-containing protein [Niveispirillum fermenti]|uniref:HIT domain-containing protein n=1 Tax=Niveispirillum fermenti TaxID=1233113 RepID=UPI003A8C70DA
MEDGFRLDERLAGDTITLGDWPLSRLLLMRNRLFAWLILVPRRAGAVEIHRLTPADQSLLMREIAAAGRLLEHVFTPDKVNIGALGNHVSQLHVHVIGRRHTDPAWPGPVWGAGHSAPYGGDELAALADRLWEAARQEFP